MNPKYMQNAKPQNETISPAEEDAKELQVSQDEEVKDLVSTAVVAGDLKEEPKDSLRDEDDKEEPEVLMRDEPEDLIRDEDNAKEELEGMNFRLGNPSKESQRYQEVCDCELLNLRPTPSTSIEPIETLRSGQLVITGEKTGEWIEVVTARSKGYCLAKFLKPSEE